MKRHADFENETKRPKLDSTAQSTNKSVALAKKTSTTIMDLDDNTISKIFSFAYFTIMDLCSIVETCDRFRDIVNILTEKYRFWHNRKDLNLTIDLAKRILMNFGPSLPFVRIFTGPESNPYHGHAQSFLMIEENYENDLLPLLAEKCQQLTYLEVRSLGPLGTMEFEKFQRNVHSMRHLQGLIIDCSGMNVTKLVQGLIYLDSLRIINFLNVDCDASFTEALLELKQVERIRLNDCRNIKNLNSLNQLPRLSELAIRQNGENVDLDIVNMVRRVNFLRDLYITSLIFEKDKMNEIFSEIEDIFLETPNRVSLTIELVSVVGDAKGSIIFDNRNGHRIL